MAGASLIVTATLPTWASSRRPDVGTTEPALAIVLRPETDASHRVIGISIEERITMAGAPQRLRLSAPVRFAGMVPVGSVVSDFTVADAGGRASTSTSEVATPAGPARRWTSDRDLNGDVIVRYRLPLTPFAQGGPPYGMKAAGLGVAGNSGSLLVLPEIQGLRRSTLHWDLSRMASGSSGVIAGGTDMLIVHGSPEALIDRWIMAGPLKAGQKRPGESFNAFTLGAPPFDATAMMAWSRRVYTSLADTFGYLGKPRYLLAIRALDAPSFATGTASVANGASLITVGSPTYLPGQDVERVKGTIAHEMTHNWVGQFGDRPAPWFNEGLTVYVSATLPCEVGLRQWSDCAGEIGKWAKDYYGSEARNWTMDRIEATPFACEDVRRVPYGRGMMYFANLDAQIRAASDGRRTLLTALRPLFEDRRAGQPLTMQGWEAWLKRERGPDAVASFRDTVLEGSMIVPAPNAFGDRLRARPTRSTSGGRTYDGYEWQAI
ncbi:hypothetical protein [Sphingomonas insulae]|uniref:hypothetical protein n=1 Tax=Sphingomonas insulae TaxID=424800 RepID=UPI0013D5D470|nr:hypothetical protein [Sphingomonas insulae]